MFRRRIVRQQKKAQAAFARKWMVADADETDNTPMFARKWGRSFARATAGVTAAFAATGGMAYAGVLPEPVQRAVSAFASDVGVELPSPDDEEDDVVVDRANEKDGVEGERADGDDHEKDEESGKKGGGSVEDAKGSGTSQAVREVKDKKDEYEDGKDFGHAVADAAHDANAERRAEKDAAEAEKVTGPPEHAASVGKPVKENPAAAPEKPYTPPQKPETPPGEKEKPEPAQPETAPQGNPNGGKGK